MPGTLSKLVQHIYTRSTHKPWEKHYYFLSWGCTDAKRLRHFQEHSKKQNEDLNPGSSPRVCIPIQFIFLDMTGRAHLITHLFSKSFLYLAFPIHLLLLGLLSSGLSSCSSSFSFVGSSSSPWLPRAGVPQRSVLGPTFYTQLIDNPTQFHSFNIISRQIASQLVSPAWNSPRKFQLMDPTVHQPLHVAIYWASQSQHVDSGAPALPQIALAHLS